MRINPINNFNQSFTSFKVTECGKKELAQKFAQNPEFEKAFVDDVIKPLSYTMTEVIYDGNNQVIIHPAHDIMNYYSIMDRNLMTGADYTHALLTDLRTGEWTHVQVKTDDIEDEQINVNSLITKLDLARRVAQQFDENNRYYAACHSPNDPKATLRYNEDKLERLFSVNK